MDTRARHSRSDAWDREYLSKRRLWAGAAADLPDLPAGSRVLEVGCGDGKSLAAMSRASWSVVALDRSSAAIGVCRENRAVLSRVEYVTGDIVSLPFPDGAFDALFATHVIGHLPEAGRARAADECARVLCPGGRLFFRDFSREDMRCGKGDPVEEESYLRGTGILTHYFTEEEVQALFATLVPLSIGSSRWTLRIRGRDLLRSEIVGSFVNTGSGSLPVSGR